MKAKKEEGFEKADKAVLAFGEVSGHSHQILEPVFVKKEHNGLASELILENPVELVHEEHDLVTLPKGEADIIIQQEYDVINGVRQVLD